MDCYSRKLRLGGKTYVSVLDAHPLKGSMKAPVVVFKLCAPAGAGECCRTDGGVRRWRKTFVSLVCSPYPSTLVFQEGLTGQTKPLSARPAAHKNYREPSNLDYKHSQCQFFLNILLQVISRSGTRALTKNKHWKHNLYSLFLHSSFLLSSSSVL